ncbi:AraC family transcriptional regulator [Pedobacter rhodius]|uniref:AraC family transcriptional regulator n=1 Tax=Pedobacter rhodius TaxID=3004098 RepID=A0ABT4KYV7_9SPHI|nr:AraC family transcriptional regulator [Pedobacter sp. SJ11]MCZ4224039.1 AraC family transcriptional regulator [Pedobacter sp. SJ11]
MQLPSASFLGYNGFSKQINGCSILLTSYEAISEFEEWHSHQNSSISLLLSGAYNEEFGGKVKYRIPGDIKFIPEGQIHRCTNYATGTLTINLDLGPFFAGQTASTSECIEKMIAQQEPQSKFILLKLFKEIQDKDSYVEASAQLLLYELLCPPDNRKAPPSDKKKKPKWVAAIREQLNDGWDDKPDLGQLTRIAGIHPVSLSRYFPQYFGMTLSAYMRQLKVDRSLTLIRSSQLSLTGIAYKCGFADQAHFTRVFKQTTGFLPKDFKKI